MLRGGVLCARVQPILGSLQVCRQPGGPLELVCRVGERVRECDFLNTPVKWPARAAWRADRAMLPAPATLPGYPANHTQTHNAEQCTHTLAAQMADWPAGCFTQQATHARTAHHRAAATSLGTLQHSTANFPHIFRPCAAPARLPLLCCATAQLCIP